MSGQRPGCGVSWRRRSSGESVPVRAIWVSHSNLGHSVDVCQRRRTMGLATTALRVTTGVVLAGHGLQKIAGKFGGPGLDAAATGFESMGFRPGRPYAAAAGVSETAGGAMLAAGLFTPLGAAM